MSKRPLVFLDLDRTLFDTRQAGLLWQELAKRYDIDAAKCTAERSNWYEWVDDTTYYHDFSQQLTDYGIDASEAYEYLRQSPLAQGVFEFPYVDVLVRTLQEIADVKVLTFGIDDYQQLKASLCPSLRGVEIITTLESKTTVLGRYMNKYDCWLVDDKPVGNELPKNVHFIQVALESEVPDYTVAWPIFTSLKEVKEYLYEQLH